jgi:hypothetical protein
MYLPEMVSYDIAVIAKLMLWDTTWIVGENRFLYRGIKYNIYGLIPKTSYVTQTLNIKYRGTIEPRATSYIFIAMFGSTFDPCRCQLIRFDQYFQGSTSLPEGYDTKLFHLIIIIYDS